MVYTLVYAKSLIISREALAPTSGRSACASSLIASCIFLQYTIYLFQTTRSIATQLRERNRQTGTKKTEKKHNAHSNLSRVGYESQELDCFSIFIGSPRINILFFI